MMKKSGHRFFSRIPALKILQYFASIVNAVDTTIFPVKLR